MRQLNSGPVCSGQLNPPGAGRGPVRAEARPSAGGEAPSPVPSDFKLSVLMPVYNESATLPTIVDLVLAVALPKEVIIVDDGSTDGSRDYLAGAVDGCNPTVRVVRHAANRGKGAAIRTAIPLATGTVCVIQD